MVDFRPDRDPEQQAKLNIDEEVSPIQTSREHENSVDALSANPVNQSQYASGSHDNTVKIWDSNTHRCVKTLRGHTDGIWSLNYMADGRQVISGGVDGHAKIWDTNSG